MRRYGGGMLYAALPLHMQRGCFRIRTHDQQVTKTQLYRCTKSPRHNFTHDYVNEKNFVDRCVTHFNNLVSPNKLVCKCGLRDIFHAKKNSHSPCSFHLFNFFFLFDATEQEKHLFT